MIIIEHQVYAESIERLAESVMKSQSSSLRDMCRTHILRFLVRGLNVSSAYVCQHDFAKKQTIVIDSFIDTSNANTTEWNSDIGEIYPEEDMGDTATWLYQTDTDMRFVQVDDMDDGDPEKEEFEADNIKSVALIHLYVNNSVWGYIEIWESVKKRIFTDDEKEFIRFASRHLSQVVAK